MARNNIIRCSDESQDKLPRVGDALPLRLLHTTAFKTCGTDIATCHSTTTRACGTDIGAMFAHNREQHWRI